ncbi:MAG: SufS family cysteine desulfurase [Candidatus Norongarragalinales archaeon]
MLDPEKVRRDFPFLKKKNRKGKPLAYLDNAATTQKPAQVLNAIEEYYERHNANPHRGIYELSENATEEYESARKAAAEFIGADAGEIIFVRNATEGMNLINASFAESTLKKGDRVLITAMEHHANIVPWLLLKQKRGTGLDYIEISPDGKLEENWERRITKKTKIVSVTHASNVLGTVNDVREICKTARDEGCTTVIDGAQAVPHLKVDVKKIGCDFYVFSGHKMLAPMGIGVVYGRRELLETMPPFLGGGDMIRRVERQKAEWNEVPWKFEAGTPNVEGAVGLKAAMAYLQKLGLESVKKHEEKLTEKTLSTLERFKRVRILGPANAKRKVGAVAFTHDKIHPHDIASVMNEHGIAIRSGHHCAMPLHQTLGVAASSRASFYAYNTPGEVERFEEALKNAERIFGVR